MTKTATPSKKAAAALVLPQFGMARFATARSNVAHIAPYAIALRPDQYGLDGGQLMAVLSTVEMQELIAQWRQGQAVGRTWQAIDNLLRSGCIDLAAACEAHREAMQVWERDWQDMLEYASVTVDRMPTADKERMLEELRADSVCPPSVRINKWAHEFTTTSRKEVRRGYKANWDTEVLASVLGLQLELELGSRCERIQKRLDKGDFGHQAATAPSTTSSAESEAITA